MSDNPSGITARSPDQIGHALARFRVRQGLSQEQLGQRAALRQPTVSNLESGRGQIKTLTDTLTALGLELVIRPRATADTFDIEDTV